MAGIEEQLCRGDAPCDVEHAGGNLVQQRMGKQMTAFIDNEIISVCGAVGVEKAPNAPHGGPGDAARTVVAATRQLVAVTCVSHHTVGHSPERRHVSCSRVERPGQVPPDRLHQDLRRRPLATQIVDVEIESPHEGALARQRGDVRPAEVNALADMDGQG